jgi:hypothetical protein
LPTSEVVRFSLQAREIHNRGATIRVEHAALALIAEPPFATVAGERFVLVAGLKPAGRDALVEARVSRNGDPAERLVAEQAAATQDVTLRHPGFSPGGDLVIDSRGYEGGREVPAGGDEANVHLEFHVPALEDDASARLEDDPTPPAASEAAGLLRPSARRRVIGGLAACGVTSRDDLPAGGGKLPAATPARDRKIIQMEVAPWGRCL